MKSPSIVLVSVICSLISDCICDQKPLSCAEVLKYEQIERTDGLDEWHVTISWDELKDFETGAWRRKKMRIEIEINTSVLEFKISADNVTINDRKILIDNPYVDRQNGIITINFQIIYEEKVDSPQLTNVFKDGQILCGCCSVRDKFRSIGNSSIEHLHRRTWDFQWYATIFHTDDDKYFLCDGSLITEQHVITSAHCVRKFIDPTEELNTNVALNGRVYLGRKSILNTADPSIQVFNIKSIEIHPEYNEDTLENNLAILKLATKAKITNYVDIISLWDEDLDTTDIMGRPALVAELGRNDMKYAVLTIDSSTKCEHSTPDYLSKYISKYLTENYFCAGFVDTATSRWIGLRGAGLVLPTSGCKQGYQLRGIALVDRDYEYNLFIDVAKYLPWIREVAAIDVHKQFDRSVCMQRRISWSNRFQIREECGRLMKTSAVPLITNSFGTGGIKDYPWHSAIYKYDGAGQKYQCGGSLITKQHIITAAHCTLESQHSRRPTNPNTLTVYLGLQNLRRVGAENVQNLDVSMITIHDKFNVSNLHNDVAILNLAYEVKITEYVRPICLWGENKELATIENRYGTVVGWGKDETGNVNIDLKYAQLPVVSEGTCLRSRPEHFAWFLSDNSYCAGYRNGTNVCNGDSGGGMAFVRKGTEDQSPIWQLRGIVSIAISKSDRSGDCDPSHYTIFTDTAKYLPWIYKITDYPLN